MKHIRIFVVFAFVVIVIGQTSCTQKKNEVIKIGALLPLTGDVAAYGQNTKQGIDLAVEQVNAQGGIQGKMIEIIYEDSKADGKTGASAGQKLIDIDKVSAIIDNSVSTVALAVAPIADKNKVVLLSTGSTNPSLSGISPYFFRIWNSDALEGRVSANFVSDSLQSKSAAIVFVNNDYGHGLADVFRRQFAGKGGTVAAYENFEQDNSNFRALIAKLKTAKFDCIYLVAYPKEIGAFLKQKMELNLSGQVIGTVTMEDKQIVEIAGSSANGVLYPFPRTPDSGDTTVVNFSTIFEKKYGAKPGITCDVGYDAVYLLAMALKQSQIVTGENIRLGLKAVHNYHGASGLIEFDDKGDVNKPMAFKTINNGEFKPFTR